MPTPTRTGGNVYVNMTLLTRTGLLQWHASSQKDIPLPTRTCTFPQGYTSCNDTPRPRCKCLIPQGCAHSQGKHLLCQGHASFIKCMPLQQGHISFQNDMPSACLLTEGDTSFHKVMPPSTRTHPFPQGHAPSQKVIPLSTVSTLVSQG